MSDLVRRIDWRKALAERGRGATDREWLVTNGLGGYASGTVSNIVTRRYHGLLIAALPAPVGRIVMLSKVWERVRLADHRSGVLSVDQSARLKSPSRSPECPARTVAYNNLQRAARSRAVTKERA